MGFWIAAAVILVAVLAVLLGTLLRGRGGAAARRDYDLVVFRDQLAEVDRDVERGVLAEDQAEAARLEIKRRMLAAAGPEGEAGDEAATPPARSSWSRAAVAFIVVLVPAGAIALYLQIGSPNLPDEPLASRADAGHAAGHGNEEMAQLTKRLAAQMQKEPNNAEGWLLLARSYRTLRNYPEAIKAFQRVLDLTDRAPAVLAEYGELLVLAHDGQVPESAAKLFQEVLKSVPTDARSRYYLGLAAAQAGNPHAALQAWVDLVTIGPKGAPWMDGVNAQIASVAAQSGIDPASIKPSSGLPKPPAATAAPTTAPAPSGPPEAATPPTAGTEPVGPGPSAADMKAAAQMTPAERQQMIRSMVEGLAERLKAQPDDPDGWRRLARAYQVLGEPDKAKDALARAAEAEKKAKP